MPAIRKGILGESDVQFDGGRECPPVQTDLGVDVLRPVRQRVDDLRGSLRHRCSRDAQVDATLFEAILRNMDCPRELFSPATCGKSAKGSGRKSCWRGRCASRRVCLCGMSRWTTSMCSAGCSWKRSFGGLSRRRCWRNTGQGVCGAGRHGGGGGVRKKGRRCVAASPLLVRMAAVPDYCAVSLRSKGFASAEATQRAVKPDECLRSPFGNL